MSNTANTFPSLKPLTKETYGGKEKFGRIKDRVMSKCKKCKDKCKCGK